jgi:hypothetical protein
MLHLSEPPGAVGRRSREEKVTSGGTRFRHLEDNFQDPVAAKNDDALISFDRLSRAKTQERNKRCSLIPRDAS